jgi:putative component of membrane protein insertase Oxa1/YidC/SpoIIIJ protein YidD
MVFNLAMVMYLCSSIYQEPWGKDIELTQAYDAPSRDSHSLLVRVADLVIRFHQEVISPVDGPRSHFRPSSSRYMQLAMQRYGFFRGYLMGCDRLLREDGDPWVYRIIEVDGKHYKYDPAKEDKYR